MHMADALISPAVGGVMWAAAAGLAAHSARRLKAEGNEQKTPLMGVLGAFVFSAQMINFSIPGTGSSGHLGGGLLLAILLGPQAGFLTIASVLAIQALFFADGGLLSLGCNIINLGFFPCFLAYPFIYKPLVGHHPTQGRILAASVVAAVAGLQLGAFGVVLETVFSGISELPFTTFLLMMLPIHLAIGCVEGLVTAAVAGTIWKARPELMDLSTEVTPTGGVPKKTVIIGILLATAVTAGLVSWFASTHPDGLEWSMHRVSGREALTAPSSAAHNAAQSIQEKTALLPDYDFKQGGHGEGQADPGLARAGTSVAGLLGAGITLVLVGVMGFMINKYRRTRP